MLSRPPTVPDMTTTRGARWAAAALVSIFLLHCSSIDERTPGVDEADDLAGSEQAMPTLQPAPGSPDDDSAGGSSAGTGSVGSPEGNAAIGNGIDGSGPEPAGGGLEPLARGAECTLQQSCEGSLVCGRSATPDLGTGRVCCDQACEGTCQGCSVGLNAGTCGPVGGAGGAVSCIAPSLREGACSEPGVCSEYCVVGQSLLGQCLVQPG